MNQRYPIRPIGGGLNTRRNPLMLGDGESPESINVDFSGMSLGEADGQQFLGNRRAYRPALRTKAPDSPSILPIEAGKSVPARGYGYLPYSIDQDIGGAWRDDKVVPVVHASQRGKAFDLRFSFKLPDDARLFTKPVLAPGVDGGLGGLGADEAFGECALILQKGGDRTAPLSWAIGLVNVGEQWQAITGATAPQRVSNYALVFMWYDAGRWGHVDPGSMPYFPGIGSSADVKSYAVSNGTWATMALRAIVFDVFIEPGRDYHCSLALRLDGGSCSYNSGTLLHTANWLGNGSIALRVKERGKQVTTRGWAEQGGLAGAYIWCGPSDSLKYLTRYGVRYHGRDPMYVGLGYRFAPWQDLGFIPFGMDSGPLETGGMRLISVGDKDSSDLVSSPLLPTWSADSANQICTDFSAGLVAAGEQTGGTVEGNPRLGINLDETQSYTTAGANRYPYNLFAGMSFWTSEAAASGSITLTDNGTAISLDSNGMPLSLATGQKLTTSLWLDWGEFYWNGSTNVYLTGPLPGPEVGTYVIEWTGGGEMTWIGAGDVASIARISVNRWEFTITTITTAGPRLGITAIDATKPPENLRCFFKADEATLPAEPYNPVQTQEMEAFGIRRFMESDDINHSDATGLSILPDGYLFHTTTEGIPAKWKADYCNHQGAHLWYCSPSLASDSYLSAAATKIRDNLDPNLVCFIEEANENWNGWFFVPKDGSGNPLFPPGTTGGGYHVYVSYFEGQITPAVNTFKTANDLIPHPTVTTWNGLTCYRVGPSAIDTGAYTDEGIANINAAKQLGQNAQNMHAQFDAVFSGEETRLRRVVGCLPAAPEYIPIIAAEATRADLMAFAMYNPPIPTQCGTTGTYTADLGGTPLSVAYDLTTVAGVIAFLDAVKPAVAYYMETNIEAIKLAGKIPSLYECGIQLLASGGTGLQVLIDYMANAHAGEIVKWMLDTLESLHPGITVMWYADYEKGSQLGGKYGLKTYPGEDEGDAPKYVQAVLWSQNNQGPIAGLAGSGGTGGGGDPVPGKVGLGIVEMDPLEDLAFAYRGNFMRGCRPWVEDDPASFSFYAGGGSGTVVYDANTGMPTTIPSGVRVQTFLFRHDTASAVNTHYRSGRYILTWTGDDVEFVIGGDGRAVNSSGTTTVTTATNGLSAYDVAVPTATKTIQIQVDTPSVNGVAIGVLSAGSADACTSMRVVHADDLADLGSTGLANNPWDDWLLDSIGAHGTQVLSFRRAQKLETAGKNHLPSGWYTWNSDEGITLQGAISLCNFSDCCIYWHLHPEGAGLAEATGTLIDRVATDIQSFLNSGLKAFIAYGYHPWKSGSASNTYISTQSAALDPDPVTANAKYVAQASERAFNRMYAIMGSAASDVLVRMIDVDDGGDASYWMAKVFAESLVSDGVQVPLKWPIDPTDVDFTVVASADDIFTILEGSASTPGSMLEAMARASNMAVKAKNIWGKTAVAYEAGQNLIPSATSGAGSAVTLALVAQIDARMGDLYTDMLNAWKDLSSGGMILDSLTDSNAGDGQAGLLTTIGVTPNTPKSQAVIDWNETVADAAAASLATNALSPIGPSYGGGQYADWSGLGGTQGYYHNNSALRGYFLAFFSGTALAGSRVRLGDKLGLAGFDLCFETLSTIDSSVFGVESEAWMFPFRWAQRDFVVADVRLYSEPISMPTTPFIVESQQRAAQGLVDGFDPDNELDPSRSKLLGCWPLDDSAGGVLRELARGNSGYVAPMSLAVDAGGVRGGRRLFLSGEGEHLVLSFADNPIFEREVGRMLAGTSQGFAVEVTCMIPEASYGLESSLDPALGVPRFVSDLVSWEVEDPDAADSAVRPRPILRFGPASAHATGAGASQAFTEPLGIGLRYAGLSDQKSGDLNLAVPQWSNAGGFTMSREAPWVGRAVTIQAGVQPTSGGAYRAYLALLPAGSFLEGGDPAGEAILFAEAEIESKDVARSLISIGGTVDGPTLGYLDLGARLVVDEVRVFGAVPPGELPATSGGAIPAGGGKILSDGALPTEALLPTDLLEPIGPGLTTADVTEGSVTVEAGAPVYDDPQHLASAACPGAYLAIAGDTAELLEPSSIGTLVPEWYFIESASGSTLTLSSGVASPTQVSASVRKFRALGYTSLADIDPRLALALGAAGWDPATRVSGDYAETQGIARNYAHPGGEWTVRITNPFLAASLSETRAEFVAGIKAPRYNPITGLYSTGSRVLGTAWGSLFEVDDRWRRAGPSDDLAASMAFRRQAGPLGLPLAGDRLESLDAGASATLISQDWTAGSQLYGAWVKLDGLGGTRTILWVGDPLSCPDATDRMQFELVVADGVPQFRVRSSAVVLGGSSVPDGELFVASGLVSIPVDRWIHICWCVDALDAGGSIGIPRLFIGGQAVSVKVNARGWNGVDVPGSSVWLPTSTLGSSVTTVSVGCGRGARRHSPYGEPFVSGDPGGLEHTPPTARGWINCLGGLVSDLGIWRTSSPQTASFDPLLPTFDLTLVSMPMQEGAGYSCAWTGGQSSGVARLQASALIARHSQGEPTREPTSWAQFGDQVFAANGGRVLVDTASGTRLMGLNPPSVAPSVEIVRKPLWVPVFRETGNPANDPVAPAASGSAEQVTALSTNGRAYLTQQFDDEMRWEEDDWLVFKALVRPTRITGRINLWSQRGGPNSGRAIEIVDGRLRLSWYDTYLKKMVGVETSTPVFYPGKVHYVRVRKLYPLSGSTVWSDSLPGQAKLNDILSVRVFETEAPAATKIGRPLTAVNPTVVTSLGFTIADTPAGFSATGPVTGALTVNRSVGVVTVIAGVVTNDLAGMLLEIEGEPLYRISSISGSTINVVDNATGLAPTGSVSGSNAYAFIGTTLRYLDGTSASSQPDTTAYDTEFMGSALQAAPTNGIAPFEGKVFEAGWVITDSDDHFEAAAVAHMETGADTFAGAIYSATAPGGLQFDGLNGQNFAVVQATQPNDTLVVDMADDASANAAGLNWQYTQGSLGLQGTRRVRVAFYDPVTGVESYPGPELIVRPPADDQTNPAGEIDLVLSGLPLCAELDRAQRRIYLSQSDGLVLFLAATVQDNQSASVAVSLDDGLLVGNISLDFRNAPPPRARVVASVAGRMVFGDIGIGGASQPNGILPSLPYQPERLSLENLLLVGGGASEAIRGMAAMGQRLIVLTTKSLMRYVLADGATTEETISDSGVGCVGPAAVAALDGKLYWLSPRGPYAYAGSGEPVYLGLPLEGLMAAADRQWMPYSVAGIDRAKGRVDWALKLRDRRRPDTRMCLEVEPATTETQGNYGHRASRREGMRITALASHDDGSEQRFLGGTLEGMVCWMDAATRRQGVVNDGLHGDLSVPIGSGGSASLVVRGIGAGNGVHEGARGAPIMYEDANGAKQVAYVEFEFGGGIFLDEAEDATPFGSAEIGASLWRWRSRHLDVGLPERDKRWRVLAMSRKPSAGDALDLWLYVDQELDPVSAAPTEVDLSVANEPVSLSCRNSRYLQILLERPTESADADIDVMDLILTFESDTKTP